MLKALLERLRQKHRTLDYPAEAPKLPPLYRGRPELDASLCGDCGLCEKACPTGALSRDGGLRLDAGLCVFCGACADACPRGAIKFSGEHSLCSRTRDGLAFPSGYKPAGPLEPELLRLFARSLKLRQVSAGGCNACEADVNVLGTLAFDLGRFGVQFVASPRHADGLLVTGPVPPNMKQALLDTYAALPEPKIVVAAGTCAVSGGLFANGADCRGAACVPITLYIPGCPPHPLAILDGLLRLMGITGAGQAK